MAHALPKSAATIVTAVVLVFAAASQKATADDHFRRANDFVEASLLPEALVAQPDHPVARSIDVRVWLRALSLKRDFDGAEEARNPLAQIE